MSTATRSPSARDERGVRECSRPGAGTGSVLRELIDEAQKFGFESVRAIGTEYSQKCINISKERNAGRDIEFVYGGLKEVIDGDFTKFDIIILSHVFEHFVTQITFVYLGIGVLFSLM